MNEKVERVERLNLTFHPENEKEMRAMRHIIKRSSATGVTRSQYVVDCVLRCEEGGVATLTRDDFISIIKEAINSGQKTTSDVGLDFGGYT